MMCVVREVCVENAQTRSSTGTVMFYIEPVYSNPASQRAGLSML